MAMAGRAAAGSERQRALAVGLPAATGAVKRGADPDPLVQCAHALVASGLTKKPQKEPGVLR